jgi:hypothetical protein
MLNLECCCNTADGGGSPVTANMVCSRQLHFQTAQGTKMYVIVVCTKIILPLRYVEENREKALTRYPVANVRVLKELFLQIGASRRFPVGRVLHVTISTKNDKILIFPHSFEYE